MEKQSNLNHENIDEDFNNNKLQEIQSETLILQNY